MKSSMYGTGCIALFLLVMCPHLAATSTTSGHLPIKLDVSVQDGGVYNQQLLSVYCGEESTKFSGSMQQMMLDSGHSQLESIESSPQARYYVNLNDSLLDPNSTNLTGFQSSVHQNGSLSIMFYISKLQSFRGLFSCIYNATNSTGSGNITNSTISVRDLMLLYEANTDYDSSSPLYGLWLVFLILFLLALVTNLITCIVHFCKKSQYQRAFVRTLSTKHTQSCSNQPETLTSSSSNPLQFTAMGYAFPLCRGNSVKSDLESGTIKQTFSKPVNLEGKSCQSSLTGESARELLDFLSHPSPCVIVNCPCAIYKQQLADRIHTQATREKLLSKTSSKPPLSLPLSVVPLNDNARSKISSGASSLGYEDSGVLELSYDLDQNFVEIHQPPPPSPPPSLPQDQNRAIHPADCEVCYPDMAAAAETVAECELEERFVGLLETVTFDSKGGEYVNEKHEVCLKVPEGAIPENSTISIEIGVSLHSPLVPLLPPGKVTVSPLVKLCVVGKPNYRFLKPVEVTIPHFLDISDEGAERKMGLEFMKVGHGLYCFHQSDGVAMFRHRENTATLTTEHFCTFCITAKEHVCAEEIYYRLVKVTPKALTSEKSRVAFCVSYYLKTCLEALRKQFPDSEYELKTWRRFKFDESASLEIDFKRKLPGGWQLALESQSKISPKDVQFWDKSWKDLVMMEDDGLYPPRFEVKVCGSHAREPVNATVEFRGMAGAGPDATELLLEPTTKEAAGGTALTQRFHPLSAVHSSSEPIISDSIYSYPTKVQPRREATTKARSVSIYGSSLSAAPSHSDLMNFVAAVLPAKWRLVGVQLGLSTSKLDEIQSRHPYDCMTFFSFVFSEWKKQDILPYTWATIVDVLKTPSVEENRVAEDIIKQLGLGNSDSVSNRSSTGSTILSSGYSTDCGTSTYDDLSV